MRRIQNNPTSIPQRNAVAGAIIEEQRQYDIVTPLLGSGVKTNYPDPVSTLRVSSIRGMLRFWWRATRGWQSGGDIARLRNIETSIWGGGVISGQTVTQRASRISVSVQVTNRGNHVRLHDDDAYRYIFFALKGNRRNEPPREDYCLLKGVKFTLTLRYPKDIETEIHAALWAWEHFGGIGSRTRRGVGSIYLRHSTRVAIHSQTINQQHTLEEQIVAVARYYGMDKSVDQWPVGVPSLAGLNTNYQDKGTAAFHIINNTRWLDSDAAWKELIFKYQAFRQSRRVNEQGRTSSSYWPIPNEVRALWNANVQNNVPFRPRDTQFVSTSVFSGAQLGAPIIYEFRTAKDFNYDDNTPKVVHKFTLSLDEKDVRRFASPFIFRPVSQLNGKWSALYVVLAGSRQQANLFLRGQKTVDNDITNRLTRQPVRAFGTRKFSLIINRRAIEIDEADVIAALFAYMK